jgi:hypothetical protein
LEGSGNEDIFSGSGENEISDVMLDDEDLELQRVQVNFMCIPLQEVSVGADVFFFFIDVMFESVLYRVCVTAYFLPVTLPIV